MIATHTTRKITGQSVILNSQDCVLDFDRKLSENETVRKQPLSQLHANNLLLFLRSR